MARTVGGDGCGCGCLHFDGLDDALPLPPPKWVAVVVVVSTAVAVVVLLAEAEVLLTVVAGELKTRMAVVDDAVVVG